MKYEEILRVRIPEKFKFSERSKYTNISWENYDVGQVRKHKFNFRIIAGSKLHRIFENKGYKLVRSKDNPNNLILWFDLRRPAEMDIVSIYIKQLPKFQTSLVIRPERAID